MDGFRRLVSGGRNAPALEPNSCPFIREEDDSLGDLHFFNWRSSWSTILRDTFHGGVDKLLTGENAYQFGLYLYCVSMLQDSNNLVDPLLWTQESSRGHKFLSFASKRLPELAGCLEYDFSSIRQDELFRHELAARNNFERKCTDHPITSREPHAPRYVCLADLANVIIVFLWITLMSDIDEEIAPSVTGLSNLYRWLTSYRPTQEDRFLQVECEQAQQTALVFYILSGLTVDSEDQVSTPLSSKYLAMAGAGICVYRQALIDPNLPPDSISKFQVVPGYVSHAGAVFKRITKL